MNLLLKLLFVLQRHGIPGQGLERSGEPLASICVMAHSKEPARKRLEVEPRVVVVHQGVFGLGFEKASRPATQTTTSGIIGFGESADAFFNMLPESRPKQVGVPGSQGAL